MVDLVTNNCGYLLTGNMSNLHDETLESSDSDDELLGITNDPICLKTIDKPSAILNSQENFQNNRRKKKNHHNTSDNSPKDGWIYCGKSRNNRKQINQWSNTNSWLASKFSENSSLGEERTTTDKGWNNISNDYVTPKEFLLEPEYRPRDESVRHNGFTDGESALLAPTMEVINVSEQGFHNMKEGDQTSGLILVNKLQIKRPFDGLCQPKDKINKYQRMREVRGVTGFIVNIHDATNFDIDLDIVPQLHERYCDVISNQYTYQDLGEDFLENPDLNRLRVAPEVGTTYRCRLKGVGINQLPSSEHTWKSNQMCVNVKQLIDRTDGWVTCTLSDIDVYQRLLVDIVIYTSNGPINLRDYLLVKMKDEDNPIFYPYSGQRLHTLSQPFNKPKR